MKIHVISPTELSALDRQHWLEINRDNPELASPYFHPEFTLAVASVRRDTRVAILEEGGKTVGFFPFQRNRFGIGTAIGGRFSDFQGVVANRDFAFDARELLAGAGLAIWKFDHLIASQEPFAPFHKQLASSPLLYLGAGFDAYLEARRSAGSDRVAQLQKLFRKLERENAHVEFVPKTTASEVFDFIMYWKSHQCRRTGVQDVLNKLPWAKPLLRRICETTQDGFSGILSALYISGRPVAAHLGMRTQNAMHWWFPVYDPTEEHAKYSPGLLLLMKVAEYSASLGTQVLDLGKGSEPYKLSFATSETPIAQGAAATRSIPAALWRTGKRSEQWLRQSPALAPLRSKARQLRNHLKHVH